MKSLKELSEEIGLTKAALQKRLVRQPLKDRLKGHLNKGKRGAFLVDEEGENIIKTHCAKHVPRVQSGADIGAVDDKGIIKGLLHHIDEQQATIKSQQTTIQDLTESLKASQALHINTVKQALEAKVDEEDSEDDRQKKPSIFARLFKSKNYS